MKLDPAASNAIVIMSGVIYPVIFESTGARSGRVGGRGPRAVAEAHVVQLRALALSDRWDAGMVLSFDEPSLHGGNGSMRLN